MKSVANVVKGKRLTCGEWWSVKSVTDITSMPKKCATRFHYSVLAKQHLRDFQKDLGLPEHNLIQAVLAKWNWMLHMLQRALEQKHGLNITIRECSTSFPLCWRCYLEMMKGPRHKASECSGKSLESLKSTQTVVQACLFIQLCILLWSYINQSQRMAETGCGMCFTRYQSRRAYRGSQWGAAGCCRKDQWER